MKPGQLLAIAAIAATLIAIPGPDWAFILAAGARNRVVLPAAAGLVIGYALIIVVAALGVGPLVTAAPGGAARADRRGRRVSDLPRRRHLAQPDRARPNGHRPATGHSHG
jgi:hypothetical protein